LACFWGWVLIIFARTGLELQSLVSAFQVAEITGRSHCAQSYSSKFVNAYLLIYSILKRDYAACTLHSVIFHLISMSIHLHLPYSFFKLRYFCCMGGIHCDNSKQAYIVHWLDLPPIPLPSPLTPLKAIARGFITLFCK
jgi:hypothetical protein